MNYYVLAVALHIILIVVLRWHAYEQGYKAGYNDSWLFQAKRNERETQASRGMR